MEITSLRAAIDARLAKKGADEFRQATERMKQGARGATDGTKKLDTGLDRLGRTARGVGGHIGRLFAGVSAAFAIRDLVQTVARYEQTMATVRAVTRASVADFARMTEVTRDLGATTRFSASEAAEGLLFLARAGFDTDKAITALPHTLDLAAAGLLGLGEAADLASNIVSQFNLTAEETQRVSDALIVVSNRANTDVRQLGEALKYAGPIAGAFGASVEATAASLGVLGDRGIQASMAGTNLRGVMLALANPTTDAEKALTKMGLSLDEVNPATNDFVDVLKKLSTAEMGATEAGLIFGRRNAAAAIILTESTARIRELEQATKDYAGEAASQAVAQSNTLAGAFKTLRSAVEEMFLATGDAGLVGGLRSVVDTVTGAVRILAGMEDSVTGNTDAAYLLADALKAIGLVLAGIAIVKIVGGFVALAQALYAAGAAATAFLATNPLGLIALAVGALAAAYLALRSALDDTSPEMERQRRLMEDVQAATESAAEAQERYRDALYDTQKGVAIEAVQQQIQALESLAKARAAAADGSTRDLDRSATWGGNYRFNAYNPLQERVSALAGSGNPDDLQQAIRLLRAEEERLTAAIKEETEAQQNARRAEALRAQLLRSIKDAQGEVAIALAATTEEERAANSTRAKYLADADRIAKALGLNKAATAEWREEVEREIHILEEARKALADKTAAEKAAEEAKRSHEEAIRQAAEAIEAERQAREAEARSARDALNTYIADLERQVTLLEIVDEKERAVAEARLMAADLAYRGGEDAESMAEYVDEVERLVRAMHELQGAEADRGKAAADLRKQTDEQERRAKAFGDAWGRAFGDFVTGAATAEEAARNLLSAIIQLAVQEYIVKQISGLVAGFAGGVGAGAGNSTTITSSNGGVTASTSYGWAHGGIFSGGLAIPFGDGGVVDRPTFFPLRTGTGLMGEAGPEAIIPLDRGPDGKLGLSGGSTIVHMTVFTNDADSFRRSRRQILQDVKRGVR